MEELTPSSEATLVKCAACKCDAAVDDAFCTHCGYPFSGSKDEQNKFLSNRRLKKANLDEANKKVRQASNALFIVGVLTAAFGFMFYVMTVNPESAKSILIANLVLAVIYAALGVWCRVKPLAATISALSVFALITIINAIVSPISIISGMLLKVILIGVFITGIKSALKAEKLKKELNV